MKKIGPIEKKYKKIFSKDIEKEIKDCENEAILLIENNKEYNEIVCSKNVKRKPGSINNEIIDPDYELLSKAEDALNEDCRELGDCEIETEYTYKNGGKLFMDLTKFKSVSHSLEEVEL